MVKHSNKGGKPKTSTPADRRLSENNPNAGKKPATQPKPKQGGK